MKEQTMIKFEPRNQQAIDLLSRTISLLDGRKKIDEADLKSVLSFIFISRHKPYINLTGFSGIVGELVDKGILKRHSGLRNFTLSQEFVDIESQWQTVKEDNLLRHALMTKSKTFYRNLDESSQLEWDEVATVGFAEAAFVEIIDKEATLAAWHDDYRPANLFLCCDYPKKNDEETARWEKYIANAILVRQMRCVAIKGGYAAAFPEAVCRDISQEVMRFTGSATKAFLYKITTQLGRVSQSYGCYGTPSPKTLEELQAV
jgi:hypothetical protein